MSLKRRKSKASPREDLLVLRVEQLSEAEENAGMLARLKGSVQQKRECSRQKKTWQRIGEIASDLAKAESVKKEVSK